MSVAIHVKLLHCHLEFVPLRQDRKQAARHKKSMLSPLTKTCHSGDVCYVLALHAGAVRARWRGCF